MSGGYVKIIYFAKCKKNDSPKLSQKTHQELQIYITTYIQN